MLYLGLGMGYLGEIHGAATVDRHQPVHDDD